MSIRKILTNKGVGFLSFAFLTFFIAGQVASAAGCTLTYPNGNICTVSAKVSKSNNNALAYSKVSCTKSGFIEMSTVLYQKTPWGSWSRVSESGLRSGHAFVMTATASAGCRYGTSKQWRSITYVSVDGSYGGAIETPATTIGCDI